MMKIAKQLPNLITLLNLLAGVFSLLFFAQGMILLAAWMIFLAAVLDFLDGFAARALKAYSKMGEQLDSLADMVSFGVAPSFVLYHLIIHSHGRMRFDIAGHDVLPYIAFLIAIFAALRLAKFNIDDRQTDSFLGLPTPAAALLIASLPLLKAQLYEGQSLFYMIVTNTYFYIGIALALPVLMLAELPLFSLKFKTSKLAGNEVRYFFIVLSVLLLLFFHFVAIPFIILSYLFLSLVVFLADLS